MKRSLPVSQSLFIFLCCCLLAAPLWAQQITARITPDMLQARIADAKEAGERSDAEKARLIELYRQSLSNLESIRADKEATEDFREAAVNAPDEIAKIQARLDLWANTNPLESLTISASASSGSLSRKLDEELANLTAVEAKLAVLEARLESESRRPAAAREQILSARIEVERLASQSTQRLGTAASPQEEEAQRWATETRLQALQTRITTLDRELLSYTARSELLKAQRNEQSLNASRLRARVEALRLAVNERRREEAETAMGEATAALAGASSGNPLVRELAEANLDLVELLAQQIAALDEVAAMERDRPRIADIESAFRSARRKLELEGQSSGAAVGLAILEQRRQFQSVRSYGVERRAIGRSLGTVSLRILEAEDEKTSLRSISQYLDERIAAAGLDDVGPDERGELENLVQTRRKLLGRTLVNDTALKDRLYDLDDVLQRLAERTASYDDFLAKRLLWVRTTKGADKATWAGLPGELARYLSPVAWLETLRFIGVRLVEAPVFLLLLLFASYLALRRGYYRAAIAEASKVVGRIREDNMWATFKGLYYSVLLAAPLPVAGGAIAASLVSAPDAPVFANAVGMALTEVSLWLVFPLILLVLFDADGVGERHFRWDREVLRSLRYRLSWFVVVAFPAEFVLVTSRLTDEQTGIFGGALTLIAFSCLATALLALFVGIGHPTKGTVAPFLAAHPQSPWWRWRYLWFGYGVAFPVALIVLTLSGFNYTASQFGERLFQSLWLVTAIWVGGAVVRRWLLITSNRLAFQKAVKALEESRARRAQESGEPVSPTAEDGGIGESEIDLQAMDADSRKLLNAFVLLLSIFGLIGIWGDVLPALNFFEDVRLWNRTALIDGLEQLVPVTAGDLIVAVFVAIGGYILVDNLPSLINIILLKQGSVSAGGRYAVQTLTSYAIVAAASLFVLNTVGLNASQLGWAAAALGVGIGFGLQEIVANFICGLILLFERPVRVGDMVTIGTETGVVSKIRIRATTLRDWEKKELIVPNKELITGRLLNWTLTDSVTRLYITVGVAYGSDVERAMTLIMDAAIESEAVLQDPEPSVHFEEFADSSLNLSLRAFVGSLSERLVTITALHKAIDSKFREAGIVIAFPQRDVHVFRTGAGTQDGGSGI